MFGSVRELLSYQDEPGQLRSGSFGKNALVRLGFELREDRTALTTLHRRAPLIVQQALYWDDEMPGLPCVSIISNSGGILQGDRNTIEIDMAPGAQAYVTTQAATRIHEMDANFATQLQTLTLGADSYLEYLPHPIIPFRNSRFLQSTTIRIDPTATLIYSDILMSGRKYYGAGEVFHYAVFSSTVRAERPDGSSLFTEKFVIEPQRTAVSRLGVMGDFHVFGNVIVLTPKPQADRLLEMAQAGFDSDSKLAVGASRLPYDSGLIFKVLGMESAPVSAQVRRIWSCVRQEVVGARVPDNFLWA